MKRSRQTNPEGRTIAAAIRDAERRGYSQQIIADSFGINVRTVRKIKTGETPGTRTYKRQMHVAPRKRADENTFNAEFVVGRDANGNEVIASTNVVIPNIGGRTPTPFDVFRTNLDDVVAAERLRLARKYNVDALNANERYGRAPRLRRIASHRKRAVQLTTGLLS